MDDSINEMREQAYTHLKEGYFEDAVGLFSNCLLSNNSILSNPEKAKLYYGRGMANFKLKKWKPAIADFEKAKELDAGDPEYCLALAMSLAIDNKIYEAIDCYEQLLAKDPKLVLAHIRLAMLYYQMGVILKGHRQLDIALASRPSLAERKTIEDLRGQQLILDKKRFYKPDFENLRQQNRTSSISFMDGIKSLFGYKGK